ncbi:hypothetical protein [Actinoplanes regularis]|uniref:hypothetical protein n=1 Tax=Actinoplanes regularis TaxID=52697 RepID=UPI0024A1C9CA|nr:hypothetical protein [Actinoplanes regularis]GLW30059.1 hypothetical protein Areg01_29990 [Actinoplanes regularis]
MSRRLWPLAALAMATLISAGCSNAVADTSGDNTAAAHEKAVKFAECMRENGVKGFPDPDASGELTIDGVLNGSSLDPESAAWKRAVDACKDLQPPGFTGDKRSAEQQANVLEFAQCVRDNGVKDFPDPTADAPIVDTNRIPSAATSGGMSALNAAMQKCRDHLAGVVDPDAGGAGK